MKLSDQVCNLELSKKLQSLGVKQESYFYHVERQDGEWVILNLDNDYNDPAFFSTYKKEVVSAFTVAELLSLLEEQGKETVLIPLRPKENSIADYLARYLINEKELVKI